MISPETIEDAKNRLIAAYKPVAIYLFGAYGWGHPDDDDDLCILIIIESSNEKVYKRGDKAFNALLSLEIPTSTVVFTQQEFDTFSQDITSLTYEVKTRGKLLYARN